MAFNDEKKRPVALNIVPVRSQSTSSTDSSSTSSLKQPLRSPRFAEATTVYSPIEKSGAMWEKDLEIVAQPGDVGFGYISNGSQRESVAVPMTPKTPLKSAMKLPGTPGRFINPMSPTFREEQLLDRREELTEKEQAKDLKIKTRVRMAKFALRSVSFSCSLIVLSMLTATFTIFDATKQLPAMNNLPPWALGTNTWPQKVVLASACVTLSISILIFIGYCRGGHKRAEKVGVYYTLFACGWFIFSMVMWAAAAGILQFAKSNSNNKDLWGWSCIQNERSTLFSSKVDYALVCRLQNWSLLCAIIEILVEVISIVLYSVIFYRYYSKRRLHKTMDMRDRARSDLYLAQLRTQSAPNTPGFGPKSPSFSQYAMSPRFPPNVYRSLGDIDEKSPFTPGGNRLNEPPQSAFSSLANPAAAASDAKPFKLQAPPVKPPSAKPKLGQGGLLTPTSPTVPAAPTFNEHAPVAPGEQQYAAVPIPGAYS